MHGSKVMVAFSGGYRTTVDQNAAPEARGPKSAAYDGLPGSRSTFRRERQFPLHFGGIFHPGS